nr:UbiA family prenyltransferase [Halorientalis brevis]
MSLPLTAAPLIAALVTLGIYTANKLTDLDEDSINRPEQVELVTAQRTQIVAAILVSLFAAAALAVLRGGPAALAITLCPVVAGVFYNQALVPGRDVRLKDVFAVNTVLVAGAWAIPLTLLPSVLAGSASAGLLAAATLFMFLKTVVSVEVFNVRDVAGDRASGVATVPVVLGLEKTKYVLYACDLLALAALAPFVLLVSSTYLVFLPFVLSSLLITSALDTVQNRDLLCLLKDAEYLGLAAVGLLFL